MQPTIVNRAAIRTVVSELVAQYIDPVYPPLVVWDVGDDDCDYSRNENGGGKIELSIRNIRETGTTRTEFIQTPGDEHHEHTIVRNLTLVFKIESDVYAERDLAYDMAETIRSKAYWPKWLARFQDEAGISILKTINLNNATSNWDGRPMTFATLELDCLTSTTERDDDFESELFATSATSEFIDG